MAKKGAAKPSPKSRKPSPKSRTPSPKSRKPSPKSRKPSPKSRDRPVETASEQAQRQLVDAAIGKMRKGLTPSEREVAALRRFEKEQEQKRRVAYYKTVSKGDYQRLSGRPSRTLIDQAQRYGLPYPLPAEGRDAKVNLFEMLKWWHDFLAKHGQRLAGSTPADPLMGGPASPALERYRHERAQLARLDRLAREQSLLPRDAVRGALTRVARIIRAAGESLLRQHGPDAQQVLSEALDECARETQIYFGKERDGN